jgi:MFS family permease
MMIVTSETFTARQWLALVSLYMGAFLPALDYFIVNLALPAIQTGLHAKPAQIQLTVSAYSLAYAVTLITGGRLGDLYGRRLVFMIGMGAFVVASAMCGLAINGNMLVGGRFLQGASASMITPQVLASIRTVFPIHIQARLMGIYGFVYGLSLIVGQIGGGALIALHPFGLDWRVVFLVNIPIGLMALTGSWRYLAESRSDAGRHIDIQGSFFLTLGLVLLIYPLTVGRELGWPAWSLLCMCLSIPTFAVFVQTENRMLRSGRDPLVDMSVIKRPGIATGLLLAFLFYSIAAFFLTYGIFFQEGHGWTPLESGLLLAPYGAGYIFAPLATPWLGRRIGNHSLTLGFGLLTVGYAICIPEIIHIANQWPLYAALFIAGTGQGITLPTLQHRILENVESRNTGMTAGITVAMLHIGVAFASAFIAGRFFSALDHADSPEGYNHAMQICLEWMLVPLTAGFMVSALGTWRESKLASALAD